MSGTERENFLSTPPVTQESSTTPVIQGSATIPEEFIIVLIVYVVVFWFMIRGSPTKRDLEAATAELDERQKALDDRQKALDVALAERDLALTLLKHERNKGARFELK